MKNAKHCNDSGCIERKIHTNKKIYTYNWKKHHEKEIGNASKHQG